MASFRNLTAIASAVLAGCATVTPPAPASLPAPAIAAPPPAPGPRRRPIPFPPGTFIGEVAALDAPTVTTRGELLVIGFSLGGVSPVECLLSRADLAAGGSAVTIGDQNRGHFALGDLSAADVTMRPPLPALFLTLQRPLGRVKVASYRRGPQLSLVCVQPGPQPPDPFEDVVAALAASLRPAATALTGQVWNCRLTVEGGGTGWGWSEMTGSDGVTTLRTLASFAYQLGDGIVLVEADLREETDARGRIVSSTSTRTINGKLNLRSRLTRLGDGTYQYDVTLRGDRAAGMFSAPDGEGLVGIIPFARRLRDQLLTGRASELRLETYDPFESPDTATVKSYRLESPGTRKVLVTVGARQSHELLDENGYALDGEYGLHDGNVLSQSCRLERPRR